MRATRYRYFGIPTVAPAAAAWTRRGGDRYTELGGATQECRFDKDLYVNPGPWRIP